MSKPTVVELLDRRGPLARLVASASLLRSMVLAATALVTALALIAPDAANATRRDQPRDELVVSGKHQRTAQLINYFMRRYHYIETELDDELSGEILDLFLESLDPNRSYFIREDIDRFQSYRTQFDDFIRQARIEPAFSIFDVYRTRVAERTDFALHLLDQHFDFSVDEAYRFDRSDAPWAVSRAELDSIWHKRVKNDVLTLRLTGKEDRDIRETLRARYEQIDRRTQQLNADDVFQIFMNSYVGSVEPHTNYFSPRASENFRIRMSLSLEGIGAVLQTENEYTMVRRIVTGGPADASSELDPGDRIVGVGQGTDQPIVDVIGWRLDDVVDLIRGPKGSVVRLEVLPRLVGSDGGTRVINLIRDRIKLEDQAAQKSVIEIPNKGETYRVGVIELPTFYIDFDGRAQGDPDFRSTTRDVRRLIEELTADGIDGLIMDLRGNGGGALSEATSLTGLFIESGPIVQVRDQRGRVRINTDPDPDIAYDGPLVVLVDRNSASASEIFAAAIQDYKRGLIVGEPTFGKGTVQNLIDLDSYSSDRDEPLGQLKVTIAEFFRINGDSTQHRGVVPDVSIPIGGSSDKEGERAFSNALPWSYIEQTEHELFRSSWNENALKAAMNEHRHRIGSDPGLVYLMTNAAMNEQIAEQTSISLLESKRRDERLQREQTRLDAENTLRRARGLSPLDELPQSEEEEIVVEDDEDEDNAFPGDILLDEAGRILADYLDRAGSPRVTLAPSTDDDTAMTTAPVGATISK